MMLKQLSSRLVGVGFLITPLFLIIPHLVAVPKAIPPESCVHIRTYDLIEESYNEYIGEIDWEEITLSDILDAKHVVRLETVEECIDEAGNLSCTVTLHNVQDIYKSWMPQVAKRVVSDGNVKLFNSSGTLLYEQNYETPVTQEERDYLLENGFGDWLTFSSIQPEEVQELQNQGFIIEQPEDGVWLISNDSIYLSVNENNLTTVTARLEEGITQYSIEHQFVLEGSAAPLLYKTIQKTPFTTLSGLCGNHVLISTYSNIIHSGDAALMHRTDKATKQKEKERAAAYASAINNQSNTTLTNVQQDDEIRVFPNPAENKVFIQVPANIAYQGLEVEIYDNTGKRIRKLGGFDAGERIEVDITALPIGTYQVKMLTNTTQVITRFIKH